MSTIEKHWRWLPTDTQMVERIIRQTGVSPVIAQLLAARRIEEPDGIRSFLEPKLTDLRDPNRLPGAAQAAELLFGFVRDGKRIVVYGDYDADGMTATSIMVGCLKAIGADVTYYVPNRLEDGYGLSCESLQMLRDRGREVVVTVDCGVCSVEEADFAKSIGLQLIVTDHHQTLDRLPDAAAIVHPALPGGDYPFAGLCGAGVALKLAWATCQRASGAERVMPALREYLLDALSLAAIGTIADVVPLVDENRALVRHGLQTLLSRPTVGLVKLMELTKLLGKSCLSSEDVAFTLAPRLNAAGRLGQAALAVELLTTNDSGRAEALATYLQKLNGDRETLERSIMLAASKQIREQFREDDPAFVLAAPQWHAGVIGVVAGRLAERYHRPVVIISLDAMGMKPGTGSARSPSFVNLHEALQSCREHLVTCGGHAAAAGLRIEERAVDAFRAAFCEFVAAAAGGQQPTPEIAIDAEVHFGSLDVPTVSQIDQLAPFGSGNPRPILVASGVELAEPPKTMGGGDRHFAGRFKQHGATIRGIAFGQGEWVERMNRLEGKLDLAFRPVINEFNGMRRVEMHVVDWRQSTPT